MNGKYHSGFSLIELLVVLSLILSLSVFLYDPVVEGAKNIQFQGVVAEAQTNINECYWKVDPSILGACFFKKSNELDDWYAGYYDYSLNVIGADTIPVLKVKMPLAEVGRSFLGVSFADSKETGEPNETHKLVVYPRATSVLPMLYSLHARADGNDSFD